ncbi:hypothetical protein SAMN05216232_3786 [Virgibacillus subterraneus]|uniref:Uncharacterized protein n=1 Tax=Virgibacillus subterraneus TaxID=621109 RepID=A0A1H9K8H7_9BACI|nr:hypothetical protein [Virgibacillus subterraneus]SEQ95372.1 hypothetical protein SAMN05216232_3786 [Virgibacillus subterraneus]
MFSFRGDAHKLFLTLKKLKDIHSNKDLKEAAEIKSFYESLESETLRLIYYRMVKEQNGTGIIPIFVTAIPWLLFLFSDKIQDFLFKDGILIWAIFITIYLILLTVSAFFHFKEKAWAALHIEIIKDVLEERDNNS